MTPRHQHDTLDQIIAKALVEATERILAPSVALNLAVVVRDALIAEGRVELTRAARGSLPTEHSLVIPLLVGVGGCGNAKEGHAMKKIDLGDTVSIDGNEGVVTGTMTLQPPDKNPVIKRSVCVSWNAPRTVFVPPSWHPVEDVVLVAKAQK